jgi:hypothetical protein
MIRATVWIRPWSVSRDYVHVHETGKTGTDGVDSAVVSETDMDTVQRVGVLSGLLEVNPLNGGWRLTGYANCRELCHMVRDVIGYSDFSVKSVREQVDSWFEHLEIEVKLDDLEICCLDIKARNELATLASDCDNPWDAVKLECGAEGVINGLVERKAIWEALVGGVPN